MKNTIIPGFAGVRDDGCYAYVVTTRWFDLETRKLVWALTFNDVKAKHGFTREPHVTAKVKRATVTDVEELDRGNR